MTYNYKTDKYAKFNKLNTNHGRIADWFRKNPSGNYAVLKASGLCDKNTPNKDDYYEEFIAYRQFFRELDEQESK